MTLHKVTAALTVKISFFSPLFLVTDTNRAQEPGTDNHGALVLAQLCPNQFRRPWGNSLTSLSSFSLCEMRALDYDL